MQTTEKQTPQTPEKEVKSDRPTGIEKFLFNRQILAILLSFMLFIGGCTLKNYLSIFKN